jgi:hypothetical protein
MKMMKANLEASTCSRRLLIFFCPRVVFHCHGHPVGVIDWGFFANEREKGLDFLLAIAFCTWAQGKKSRKKGEIVLGVETCHSTGFSGRLRNVIIERWVRMSIS